jgi:flagellar biogenesis protein FliO
LFAAVFAGEAKTDAPQAPPAETTDKTEKPDEVEKPDKVDKTVPGKTTVSPDGTINWSSTLPKSRKDKRPSRRSTTSVVGSMVFWLVVVIATIFVLVWGMRRFLGASKLAGSGSIGRILGRSHVSPKHQIAYLHVGGRVLVIGLAGDTMINLSEITEPSEVEALVGSASGAQPGAIEKTFRRFFKRERSDMASSEPAPAEDTLDTEEARLEIERVRRMVNTWRDPADERGETA